MSEISKQVITIEGLNELNSYLFDRIETLAFEDYYLKLSESKDSIDVKKLTYSYKLYNISTLIDSLTKSMSKSVIAQTKLGSIIQDTISYEYLINNYSFTFSEELLKDKTFQDNYKKIVDCQKEIQTLKKEIVSTQFGKGFIECREIGEKLDANVIDKPKDYWDMLFLLEKSRYTLYREILCSFTNLHSYGQELRYKYTLRYDGKFPNFKDTTKK